MQTWRIITIPSLTIALRLTNRASRWVYTRWYAQLMRVPHRELEINGPCLIHGGGKFLVGRGVVIRSNTRQTIELYCAPGARRWLFFKPGRPHNLLHAGINRRRMHRGDEALILDSDFHGVGNEAAKFEPVKIEKGAWVGARAIILKGVTIGEGAIVGAGAVVTHSVPPRSLCVGNPAQVVRQW